MFNGLGKTVGQFILLKREVLHTDPCVVLDIGLCVFKGIMELQKRVVYSWEVIEKSWYWSKNSPCNSIVISFGKIPLAVYMTCS